MKKYILTRELHKPLFHKRIRRYPIHLDGKYIMHKHSLIIYLYTHIMGLLLSSLFCSTNSSHEWMVIQTRTSYFQYPFVISFLKPNKIFLFFSSLCFFLSQNFKIQRCLFIDIHARETYIIVSLAQSQRAYEIIRCY